MANNHFIVDLGNLSLSDLQKKSINAAIQRAVAGELANMETSHEVALFPRNGRALKFPGPIEGGKFPGPILWGIIARPFDEKWAKDIFGH